MADQSGWWHENMAGARRGIARAVHKGRSQESTAGYSQSQDLAPRADRMDPIAACIVSPSMEAFTVLVVERLAKLTDTLVFGALSFSRRRSGVSDASGPLGSLGRRKLRGNSTAFCSVDEPELIAGHAVCLDGITATEQSAHGRARISTLGLLMVALGADRDEMHG